MTARPSPAMAALADAQAHLAALVARREIAQDQGAPLPHPAVIEAAEKALETAERKVAKRRKVAA